MFAAMLSFIRDVFNDAGPEPMLVAVSCICFLILQSSKWKWKANGSPGKGAMKNGLKFAVSCSRPPKKSTANKILSSCPKSSIHLRDKIFVDASRSRRTFFEAMQGLERYKAIVWEQGADLTACFSEREARSYFVNLLSCVVQLGTKSLPPLPHVSEGDSLGSAAGWIKHLLADMRKFGFTRDRETYLSMMKLFAAEKLWKEVLSFPAEIVADGMTPDSGLLVGFMTAAVALDDASNALHFFRTLARLAPPSQRTYMTVLRVFTKNSDWKGAVELCQEMKKFGSSPDACVINQVLGLCILQGQVTAAEQLMESWEHVLDVISFNTLLKGYAQAGSLPLAEGVLERMLSKGPAPNVITFNTVMECCFRAMQMLDPSSQGVGSDPAQEPSSGRRLAQLNQVAKKLWSLLDQLMKLGFQADRYTCSFIAKSMHLTGGSAEEIDRFIGLLEPLKSGFTSAQARATDQVDVIFNTLLDICSSSQELVRMQAIVGMMQASKIGVSDVTFSTMIKAFGQAGQMSRCHEAWKQMRDSRTKPTVVTFGCYINACIRNKELAHAEAVFRSMGEDHIKPNVVIYTSLIRGLASAGQPERAFSLYKHMRAAGVEPTSVTLNSVLDMVIRQLHDPSMIEGVINDLQSVISSSSAPAYGIVIKACCETLSLDIALSFWRRFRAQGISFDEGTFSIILHTCARAHCVSEVEEIFCDMRQVGLMPNKRSLYVLVNHLQKSSGRKSKAHSALVEKLSDVMRQL